MRNIRYFEFYLKILYTENYQRKHSKKNKQKKTHKSNKRARLFSKDLIYAVSNGRIKLSKQICLGMSLKSSTNNKKIINILNRYRHCSYIWKTLKLRQHLLPASILIFTLRASIKYLTMHRSLR